MAIVKGSEYTKGKISYARTTTGKLVRTDRPTKQVGVAVATPGKKRKGKAAQKLTKAQLEATQPKTIAIAVGKEDGKTVVKNIEPYVGKSGVKQLSRLTDVYGRLETGNFQETTSREGITRSVDVYAQQAEPRVQEEIVQEEAQQAQPTPEDPIFAPAIMQASPPKTFGERIAKEREMSRVEGIQTGKQLQQAPKQFVFGLASSFYSTGVFVKELVTKPKQTIIAIGTGLKQLAKGESNLYALGDTLREEGAFSSGFITGELLTAKGTGAITKTAGTKLGALGTKLSPGYVAVKEGSLGVKTTKGLKEIKLAGGVSSTAEPLKTQVKLAGQQVEAVSAQRSLFKRSTKEIIVDKPLPSPDSPLLEKSFFADPRGRVRQSRLGIVPEDGATTKTGLLDSLTSDITFVKDKPQVLIFPETKVSKLPKNIESKLSKGQPLTTKEAKQLETFQQQVTGEFKPVGFLSTESEITLAPGEIITKQKRVGVTVLEGQRVEIFETGIKQQTGKGVLLSDQLEGAGRKTLSSAIESKTYVEPISKTMSLSKQFESLSTSSGVSQTSKGLSSLGTTKVKSKPGTSSSDPFKSLSQTSSKYIKTISQFTPYPSKPSSPKKSRASPAKSYISPSRASSIIQKIKRQTQRSTVPRGSSKLRPTRRTDYSGMSRYPSKSSYYDVPKGIVYPRPKEDKRKKDFIVEIRQEGKFRAVKGGFSTVSQAYKGGRRIIGQKAAASYRIRDLGTGKIVTKGLTEDRTIRKSKFEEGVLIERLGKRIKSGGELSEITFKGVRASRSKSKKRAKVF